MVEGIAENGRTVYARARDIVDFWEDYKLARAEIELREQAALARVERKRQIEAELRNAIRTMLEARGLTPHEITVSHYNRGGSVTFKLPEIEDWLGLDVDEKYLNLKDEYGKI